MKKSSFSFANILLSLLVIFIIYYVVMYISNNSVNMKSSTKEGFKKLSKSDTNAIIAAVCSVVVGVLLYLGGRAQVVQPR